MAELAGRSRFGLAKHLGWLLAASAAPAWSQTLPPSAPGPTREEVVPPAPDRPRTSPPRLAVEGDVERAPCALDRPEYENVRFTPTEVRFDDLQGLTPERMREAYAPFIGQEQPVRVVCEIRDRAATILREAGYLASVEVPEQRIADGRIRFQVLMAKLVGIRVRGNAGRAERRIAGYLERLTEQPVFNRFEAERYLLLASDIPGYSVRLNLRSAGGERGEVMGEVTVLHMPVVAELNLQNLGSRELGRWGAMARAQLFGLTGLADRTILTAFTTVDVEEQQTLQLAHDFRIGSEGLSLGGQVTHAWARPDLGAGIDVEARTLFASLEAGFPFIRRQSATLRGHAGLELIDQDVDFGGADLSRDRLRIAFLRLTADAISTDSSDPRFHAGAPRWRLAASAELRQGLDILSASPDCRSDPAGCVSSGRVPPSRLVGDPTALVFRGTAQAEYRPAPRLTASLGARFQHSGSSLLGFEQFSAGNYTIGRGYDPGSIIGDRGVAIQAELRAGSTYPLPGRRFAAEPFIFIDQAWTWNAAQLAGELDDQELTSVGGGIRAFFADRFRLEAMVAVPLDRVGAGSARDKPDPRFLVSLTTRFWPWRL